MKVDFGYLFRVLFAATYILSMNNSWAIDNSESEPWWRATLGGGAVVAPEFEGSNKNDVQFAPLVEVELMNRLFLSTDRGIGVYIIDYPDWKLNASATWEMGRKEKDSDLLKGLGDIDGGAAFSIYSAWTPGPFTVSLESKYGTGDVQGLNVIASLGYTMQPFTDLNWQNTLRATFADSRYNNRFFGISRQQSKNSRYRYNYYDAGMGVKDMALTSLLSYQIADDIVIVVEGEYKLLSGPAARSPLVKAGAKDQFFGLVGVGYSF